MCHLVVHQGLPRRALGNYCDSAAARGPYTRCPTGVGRGLLVGAEIFVRGAVACGVEGDVAGGGGGSLPFLGASGVHRVFLL